MNRLPPSVGPDGAVLADGVDALLAPMLANILDAEAAVVVAEFDELFVPRLPNRPDVGAAVVEAGVDELLVPGLRNRLGVGAAGVAAAVDELFAPLLLNMPEAGVVAVVGGSMLKPENGSFEEVPDAGAEDDELFAPGLGNGLGAEAAGVGACDVALLV